MMRGIDLRLAELLVARLCHDLAGPVGAIANGVELLAEEDREFVRDAVTLVSDSAHRAGSRLQFYRFAYGFSRSATLAGPPPYLLASQYFERSGIACDYAEAAREMPLERQKLACNLLLVGAEGLSRGGRLALSLGAIGPELEAVGDGAGLSAESVAALMLATPLKELGSRTAQPYFAGLLAAELGCRLEIADEAPGRFRIAPAATR